MTPRELIDALAVAERLKDATRHCYTSGGRHESVAEHSWRAALMAYFMQSEFPQADINKVIKMCLIHDLGEAFTGDIPSFQKTKENEQTEDSLLAEWVASLPQELGVELKELYAEMNERKTLEAKIYKAIDGLEAVIQHNESDLSTWIPIEYELNLTYAEDKAAFSPYLTELRQEIRNDTVLKIAEAKKEKTEMNKWEGFEQGVNFGGWLSQCVHTKEHYDSFITEEDFAEVSKWNIDHIRIPVDYNLVETREGDYIESGFEYIERSIGWCRKYHLNMVLDLHKTAGFSFDDGENEDGFFESEYYQERFCRLWEQFAERFGGNSDMLAFELLNEVTEQRYGEKWNEIVRRCIGRIRNISPDTVILVGGYWNNSAASVKDLDEPYDKKIVYNFHCYNPLVFTHQGAYWVKNMPLDYRCSFDGTLEEYRARTAGMLPGMEYEFDYVDDLSRPVDENYFVELFKEAYEHAEKSGIKLYCGEYGVIELADREEACKWYAAIHKAFRHYGIGHAAWNYKKMDFDLAGNNMKQIFE